MPPPIASELASRAPWVAATALAVLGVDGDRRTNQDVANLAPIVLQSIQGRPQAPFGPQVWVEAFTALAGIVLQLPDAEAGAVLDLVEPLVPRDPNHARRIDDQILAILAGLYDGHARLRGRARQALLSALDHDGLADGATDVLIPRIGDDRLLQEELERRAEAGQRRPALILACVQIPHPKAIVFAEETVATFLDKPPHTDASRVDFGGSVDLIGGLARLLPEEGRIVVAQHLLLHAQSSTDMEVNRSGALMGLMHLVSTLPEIVRDHLFADCIQLADPAVELSAFDAMARDSQHPLSGTRINIGAGDLPRAAILTAARCARSRDHVAILRPYLRRFILSQDDADLNTAARALLALESVADDLVDIADLAEHPSRHLRSAAVWFLTHRDAPSDALCRLTNDADESVRRMMAASLGALSKWNASLAESLREQLLSDSSARVRLLAESYPSASDDAEPGDRPAV
jgi:hypothetical protein